MIAMGSNSNRDRKALPLAKVLRTATWIHGAMASAMVGLAAFLIYVPGERWWPTSIVLFGPTWLLHLVVASAAASWLLFHRGVGLGVLLAISELVLLLPVLGYQPPWPNGATRDPLAPVRVVTWNVGGQSLDPTALTRLFTTHGADIAVFQECRGIPKEALPSELSKFASHESVGLCMLSRLPVTLVEERPREDVWKAAGSGAIIRYTFDGKAGPFTLTNVHLETPREGFEAFIHDGIRAGITVLAAKNEQRYVEARLAHEWTSREPALPRLVAGDFNTPPQSDLLRNAWPGYRNCFGAVGQGFGHTKQTRWLGVRIDHVLASPEWECASSEVLSGFPSDHRPVLTQVGLARP